jgi:hypothetical protein
VALISVNFFAVTVVVLGLIWFFASLNADPRDKSYESYEKVIEYLTYLPALSGRYGFMAAVLWNFHSLFK